MLTSRELASLIWLAVAAVGIAVMAARDRSLARSISNIIRLAVRPPISLVVIAFYVYMAASLWLTAQLRLWNTSLTAETITWGVVSGLALIFSASDANDATYFKKAIRRTFGITVLFEVTFGMVSFPLWLELAIQPIFTFLIVLEVVAKSDPEHHQVASCLGTLLALVGFIFFGGTLYLIWHDRESIDWIQQGRTLAMLVWLPLVALPFVYVLAWGLRYGVLVRLVKWRQHERPVRFRTRAAVVLGFNFGLRDLGDGRLHLAQQLADAGSFAESYRAIRSYRTMHPGR